MVDKARTILLNAHARWPEMVNMELWTFAIRHVVTQWNHTPRKDLQYRTPEEVFNNVPPRANKKQHFKDFHPFGCPVYVLEENLQDGKKEPRWNPRSRVGIYLGRSREHASNVAYVLNPRTDCISAQYHLVFDNDFQTVTATDDIEECDVWSGLWKQRPPDEIIPQMKPVSFEPPQSKAKCGQHIK